MQNFLEPKTIAVIGASDKQGKVGYSLMKNLKNFKGKVIPINIKHEHVFGFKAYKSVLDCKENIDLAVIAIPGQFVNDIIEQCGKKQIKSVIVISAGFSEVGNRKEEEKIVETARKYCVRLLGPNCFGVCNPYLNLDTTFAMQTPEKGDIAFISQSGALWSYISDFSVGKFGFSGFVSLGNMADTGFFEFLNYFCKDKKTKSIILYVEKLKDGKKFIDVCKNCKKRIYAVKAGSSESGSKAAISHTASLASEREIYLGAFKQAGIELCNSLEECFEKASGKKLVNEEKKTELKGKAVIITNAGGAGALMADYCEKNDIKIIEWTEKNPFDVLGTALAIDYKNALEKLKGKNFYDFVIVILTPQNMSEIEKTAEVAIEFSKQAKKQVVVCFLGGKSIETARKICGKNNIKFFNTIRLS